MLHLKEPSISPSEGPLTPDLKLLHNKAEIGCT